MMRKRNKNAKLINQLIADAVEAEAHMYVAIEDRDELRAALRESQHANTAWARECDALRAEAHRRREYGQQMRLNAERAEAEVERMRGVVDEAIRWLDAPHPIGHHATCASVDTDDGEVVYECDCEFHGDVSHAYRNGAEAERARIRRIVEKRIDALGDSEFHRASELDDLLAELDEGQTEA
jgi:hypothetical protein